MRTDTVSVSVYTTSSTILYLLFVPLTTDLPMNSKLLCVLNPKTSLGVNTYVYDSMHMYVVVYVKVGEK